MKCALPGKYGKPLKPKYYVSTFNDSFNKQQKEMYLKYIKEEVARSYPEVVQDFDVKDEWEAHNEEIKQYCLKLARGSGKTELQNKVFEEYVKTLKEKDAQEHSQD